MIRDFYKIKVEKDKLHRAFSKLNSLYALIPNTSGCMENNCKEKGCGSWCCVIQSPQMLYVEFLHTLDSILKNWTIEQISEIIDRSVYHYVTDFPIKGCIFFNKDTNLCNCHKSRCYNCRIYGITPYEEFHPRYLRMAEKYKGVVGAIIKDQCDLVKPDKPVNEKDTDNWWNKLVDIEHFIGIQRNLINDGDGGSYRMPHDHIIYYFLSDDILEGLQHIRLSDLTDEQKRKAADDYLAQFHNKLKKLQK